MKSVEEILEIDLSPKAGQRRRYRKWYATNSDKMRLVRLKRACKKRGVEVDIFFKALARQGGGCDICGKVHRLNIDHCHKTNKARGIICNECNRAIGYFNDDPERMERAAEYVRRERTVFEYVGV